MIPILCQHWHMRYKFFTNNNQTQKLQCSKYHFEMCNELTSVLIRFSISSPGCPPDMVEICPSATKCHVSPIHQHRCPRYNRLKTNQNYSHLFISSSFSWTAIYMVRTQI